MEFFDHVINYLLALYLNCCILDFLRIVLACNLGVGDSPGHLGVLEFADLDLPLSSPAYGIIMRN